MTTKYQPKPLTVKDKTFISLFTQYTTYLHPNKEAGTMFSVGDSVRSQYGTVKVVKIDKETDTVVVQNRELGEFEHPLGALEGMVEMDATSWEALPKLKGKLVDLHFMRLAYGEAGRQERVQWLKDKWKRDESEGITVKTTRMHKMIDSI